jgi:hypothetical protein
MPQYAPSALLYNNCVEASDTDEKTMIADYMEKGFLDNIIDMFKHNPALYEYTGDLLKDERFRVRIGAAALIETLAKEDPSNISRAIPSMIRLLNAQSATLRGDAVYLLGITGSISVIPFLKQALNDEEAEVRALAKEALEEIGATP